MELVSLPYSQEAKIISVDTSATGATWVPLTTSSGRSVELVNVTGTTIEYRRGAAGVAMPILDTASRLVIGIANANEIQVRRKDVSNTPVTVYGEVFA